MSLSVRSGKPHPERIRPTSVTGTQKSQNRMAQSLLYPLPANGKGPRTRTRGGPVMRHLIKAVFFAVAITGWIVGFADTDRARNYTSRCRQAARRVADGARGVVDALQGSNHCRAFRRECPHTSAACPLRHFRRGARSGFGRHAGDHRVATSGPRAEKDERTPSAQTQDRRDPSRTGRGSGPTTKPRASKGERRLRQDRRSKPGGADPTRPRE